jgi:methyl-accepting chemotaxis protein
MNWFYNLKVRAKFLMGFIFVALIAALIGFEGITSLKTADESNTALFEKNTIPLQLAGDINQTFQRQRTNILEVIISNDARYKTEQINKISERDTEIDKLCLEYEKSLVDDADKKLYNDFRTNFKVYENLRDEALMLAESGNMEQALSHFKNEIDVARKEVEAALEKMDEMNINDAKNRSDQNTVDANASVTLMTILVTVGVIMAILLGFFIANVISKPLIILTLAADRFAKGEKNVAINIDSTDEIGILTKSFNQMMEKITSLIEYLDNLPAPVMVVNREFNIQYMNKSGANILGKNQQQLIGEKCYDNFKTGDCRTDKCACAQAMNKDITATEETIANPNDKSKIVGASHSKRSKSDIHQPKKWQQARRNNLHSNRSSRCS